MAVTPQQSQYWAYALTVAGSSGTVEGLSRSIANARVDLNPHQVDAALFALRSPLSRGVILADEVGLGKTIEAGIVIAQRWAEKKRKILLISCSLASTCLICFSTISNCSISQCTWYNHN